MVAESLAPPQSHWITAQTQPRLEQTSTGNARHYRGVEMMCLTCQTDVSVCGSYVDKNTSNKMRDRSQSEGKKKPMVDVDPRTILDPCVLHRQSCVGVCSRGWVIASRGWVNFSLHDLLSQTGWSYDNRVNVHLSSNAQPLLYTHTMTLLSSLLNFNNAE